MKTVKDLRNNINAYKNDLVSPDKNSAEYAVATDNAEGKASVPIMSSVMKAVFSWNTLISVVVTLLTVFGGKIVEYISNSK